jgi:hypothetical protein
VLVLFYAEKPGDAVENILQSEWQRGFGARPSVQLPATALRHLIWSMLEISKATSYIWKESACLLLGDSFMNHLSKWPHALRAVPQARLQKSPAHTEQVMARQRLGCLCNLHTHHNMDL